MIKKLFKENFIYLICIILFIVFVLVLKNFFEGTIIANMDSYVERSINKIVTENGTKIFFVITHIGDWYIPVLIIILLFTWMKNKYYSIILLGAYAISGLISFLTKILVSRPRPLYSLIDYPDKYSFPSGHTLTSLVFFIMLYYLLSRKIKNDSLKIIYLSFTIVIIILIAFSRLYLNVHYFTDVIGAIILGIFLILMCINIVSKNFNKKLK